MTVSVWWLLVVATVGLLAGMFLFALLSVGRNAEAAEPGPSGARPGQLEDLLGPIVW